MAQTVSIIVGPEDRVRLAALLGDRNRPLKHVQRANIIVLSAEQLPVQEVARRAGVSRPAVWRWQVRYAEQGVDGLLRDKTRKPGRAPLPTATVAKVLALTCSEPPDAVTHWTGRAVAKALGISLRAVQRIWEANRLQPHRLRTFKRSKDPAFATKVEDIVGLYMDPPCHAVVLSIDEKSQIQALDRTQPGLPLKPGKCGTMTHDYKRNGTTTLFAALNTLDGTVVGRCLPKHTHKEFIKFLNAVERAAPAGKVIHAIVDNYPVLFTEVRTEQSGRNRPESSRSSLAAERVTVGFSQRRMAASARRQGARAVPAVLKGIGKRSPAPRRWTRQG